MSVQELTDAEVWERWKALNKRWPLDLNRDPRRELNPWWAAVYFPDPDDPGIYELGPTPESAMRAVLDQLEEQE